MTTQLVIKLKQQELHKIKEHQGYLKQIKLYNFLKALGFLLN